MKLERLTRGESSPSSSTAATTTPSKAVIKVTTLPSKGLPYPKGWEVFYSPYTYGDVMWVSQSELGEKELVDFVMSGIECKGFDRYDLTVFDFQYLSVLRQVSSFGDASFYLCTECPQCKREVKRLLSIKDIVYKDLPAPSLPVVAMVGGVELEFTPLTVSDYLKAVEAGKGKDLVYLMSLQVRNMNPEEAYSLISSATGEDLLRLKMVEDYLDHGMEPVTVICRGCGYRTNVLLGRDRYFFRPKDLGSESVTSGIRFGKARSG